MAKASWITTLVAVLLLLGCGIDKPATESDEGQPTSTGAPPPSRPQALSFDDTHQHADGAEVAVTEIAAAELVAFQPRPDQVGNTGDPYTILTVRVDNGSDKELELLLTATLAYGPDEQLAVEIPLQEGGMGNLPPGEARSYDWGFIVPDPFQDETVFVVAIDLEHDKSVFSGSIRAK
jgi:hypothetical protein